MNFFKIRAIIEIFIATILNFFLPKFKFFQKNH